MCKPPEQTSLGQMTSFLLLLCTKQERKKRLVVLLIAREAVTRTRPEHCFTDRLPHLIHSPPKTSSKFEGRFHSGSPRQTALRVGQSSSGFQVLKRDKCKHQLKIQGKQRGNKPSKTSSPSSKLLHGPAQLHSRHPHLTLTDFKQEGGLLWLGP